VDKFLMSQTVVVGWGDLKHCFAALNCFGNMCTMIELHFY